MLPLIAPSPKVKALLFSSIPKSPIVTLPPLSLTTFLTTVNPAALSLFVILHTASWPTSNVILLPLKDPPAQDQLLAV